MKEVLANRSERTHWGELRPTILHGDAGLVKPGCDVYPLPHAFGLAFKTSYGSLRRLEHLSAMDRNEDSTGLLLPMKEAATQQIHREGGAGVCRHRARGKTMTKKQKQKQMRMTWESTVDVDVALEA
ncbi:uncharacterized protein PG986_010923 [Apiospora aurea]|uniref:Uncharacterized protein n=1 Tax=Apiospora aurea TaxID=335848 RepID=A0ABR1Q3Q2_9PEZI